LAVIGERDQALRERESTRRERERAERREIESNEIFFLAKESSDLAIEREREQKDKSRERVFCELPFLRLCFFFKFCRFTFVYYSLVVQKDI